jgi:hypothetical protein
MTAQRSSGDELETLYIFYEPLEGREVSRYTPEKELRGILGCYADGEFSFLGVKDGKRVLMTARP